MNLCPMTVINHYDSAWVLCNVVHYDRHDSTLLLCVQSFLCEFAIISLTQNDFLRFLWIGNIFIFTIL